MKIIRKDNSVRNGIITFIAGIITTYLAVTKIKPIKDMVFKEE